VLSGGRKQLKEMMRNKEYIYMHGEHWVWWSEPLVGGSTYSTRVECTWPSSDIYLLLSKIIYTSSINCLLDSSRSPSSTLLPSLHEYPGCMPDKWRQAALAISRDASYIYFRSLGRPKILIK
jgi:hypothetical protein